MLVGNTGEEAAFYRLLAAANGRNSSDPELDSVNLIRCGPGPVAASRVAQGVPAWRYVYEGEYPNTDIGFPGAWHGAEIAMAFGTNEFMSRRQSTAAQKKLSLAMRTAWTNFAKKPRSALRGLGWPVYAESSRFCVAIPFLSMLGWAVARPSFPLGHIRIGAGLAEEEGARNAGCTPADQKYANANLPSSPRCPWWESVMQDRSGYLRSLCVR